MCCTDRKSNVYEMQHKTAYIVTAQKIEGRMRLPENFVKFNELFELAFATLIRLRQHRRSRQLAVISQSDN